MPSFVVGVDGGTTKTIALVADKQGRILGAGRGGNSNWTGPDVAAPMRVVAETVREALRQAGLRGADVAMGVFGLAGADWPEDYRRRQAVLEDSGIARRVIVKNDALVGWRAGTRGRFGVAIVAGTGSNTANGFKVPVRPTLIPNSSSRVVALRAGNLNAIWARGALPTTPRLSWVARSFTLITTPSTS